jgi:hypothetical protein
VLNRLAVVQLEDLRDGIERWRPHADRLALCVPWYGMAEEEQVEVFRQVLRSLERIS